MRQNECLLIVTEILWASPNYIYMGSDFGTAFELDHTQSQLSEIMESSESYHQCGLFNNENAIFLCYRPNITPIDNNGRFHSALKG